jgi:hypothetical protein
MSDFDEYTAVLNCNLGMMPDGRSRYPRLGDYDWAGDHSGTYPASEYDVAVLGLGDDALDDISRECVEAEQRNLAENVRSGEEFMLMLNEDSAAQAAREAERRQRGRRQRPRGQQQTRQPWGRKCLLHLTRGPHASRR